MSLFLFTNVDVLIALCKGTSCIPQYLVKLVFYAYLSGLYEVFISSIDFHSILKSRLYPKVLTHSGWREIMNEEMEAPEGNKNLGCTIN